MLGRQPPLTLKLSVTAHHEPCQASGRRLRVDRPVARRAQPHEVVQPVRVRSSAPSAMMDFLAPSVTVRRERAFTVAIRT